MTGEDCGNTGSATRIYPTACPRFLETHSLWKDILLSLDIVGSALELPRSNVYYPLWGVDGGGIERYVEGMGGAEGVGTWIVMYKMRKDSLFSFLKK